MLQNTISPVECLNSFPRVAGVVRTSLAYCTPPQLGYKLDDSVAQALYVLFLLLGRFTTLGPISITVPRSQINDLNNALNGALILPLVMHPIFCGFTFLVMVCAIVAACSRNRGLGICIMLLAVFTLVLTTILFIIDICLVAITMSRVARLSNVLHVGWGGIPWMTLAAMTCLTIGCINLYVSLMKKAAVRGPSHYFSRGWL